MDVDGHRELQLSIRTVRIDVSKAVCLNYCHEQVVVALLCLVLKVERASRQCLVFGHDVVAWRGHSSQ